MSPSRYFCSHKAGVHSINLPMVAQLAELAQSPDDLVTKGHLPSPIEQNSIIQHLGWDFVKKISQFSWDFLWWEKRKTKKFHDWMIKLTKRPILPNCQVPNSFFFNSCQFYHSRIEVLQTWLAIFCVSFSQERKSERIFFYKIPSLVCTQLFSKNLAAPVQGLSVSFPPAKLHCILQDFKVVSIPLSKSMMISDARPLLCTDADSSNAAGISGSGAMKFL